MRIAVLDSERTELERLKFSGARIIRKTEWTEKKIKTEGRVPMVGEIILYQNHTQDRDKTQTGKFGCIEITNVSSYLVFGVATKKSTDGKDLKFNVSLHKSDFRCGNIEYIKLKEIITEDQLRNESFAVKGIESIDTLITNIPENMQEMIVM